jgi:hypothetical protein
MNNAFYDPYTNPTGATPIAPTNLNGYAMNQPGQKTLVGNVGSFSSTAAPQSNSTIQSVIPNFDKMTGVASGNIMALLQGLPSASRARTANAYFGAGTGQPATGDNGGVGTFIGNRGADLYHTQAQQSQQQGLGDLLSMIQGYSGTVTPTAGQNQQNAQFGAQLGQNASQFSQRQALDEFNAQLNAMQVLHQLANPTNPFGR